MAALPPALTRTTADCTSNSGTNQCCMPEMMMMSQSLSTYALVQCIVSAAQFASGAISFYDAYAELTATDTDGISTSPLRVAYDVLEHFRIVRAQGVMRLTLPRGLVRGWAAQNAFETQLDEYEGEQRSVRDGGHTEAGAISAQTAASTAVLLVQLSAEDMSAFLQSIAPLIAASRRTRSVSRISVTEPLPVQGVPLVDPAASVPTEATTSSRALSTASATSQEEAAEIDWAVGTKSVAPVRDRPHYQHERSRRGERDATHRMPSCVGDNAEQRRGGVPAAHSESRRTVAVTDGAAVRASDTAPGLLGGDSDDSAIGVAQARALGDAAQPLSGSLALLAGGEEKDGGAIRTSCMADALAITAADATGAAAPVNQRPPSPKHQQSQQATPPRLANTLESLAEELAELMEEAEQPGRYRGGCSEPLHRRRPTSVAVVMAELRADLQQTSRCTRRRLLPVVASTTAPSLCPSLKSTISETHAIWRPQRQQSPSAASAKAQCELNGAHAATAAAADDVTAVKNPRSAKRPMGVIAHTQGQCSARVVGRNGGGAHLCASEISSPLTAEVPRLPTHATCDDCITPQDSRAMLQPAAQGVHDGVNKAATATGAAVFDAQAVGRACDDWGDSESRRATLPAGTATHAFADAVKDERRDDDCTAPAAMSARRSSQSFGAASSAKLGDILAVPDATCELSTAAEGAVAPARRTVQFQSNAAGAVPSKSWRTHARNSSVADVTAYLRELFPVEETVPKPARKRRKAQTTTVGGAVRGLSVCQPRRRAPARRAINPTVSVTGAAAPALASAGAPSTTADGETVSPVPVKSASSPPLSVPTKVSEDISSATGKRRLRSPTADAVGAAKKRANVRTAATVFPSRNDIDTMQGIEASAGGRKGSGTGGSSVGVRLPKPPQAKALSADSVRQHITITVRDAGALGMARTPLPLRVAASATKSGAVTTALVAPAEEAAADTAVEEGSAAAVRSYDAAKVVTTLANGSGSESDSDEAANDAVYHRRTQLPQTQLFTRDAARPAGCTDGPGRYRAGAAAADHPDQTGDGASVSSSQATCPLLYCRESRKERSRRVLRYMNLLSQSMAAMHETHDALRGLLLLMMGESQL